jgi:hypothetical protein
MLEPKKKSGPGCLFYGGVVAAILLSVLVLAGFLGYRYARSLVAEYTDDHPASLPAVQLSDEAMSRLRERVGNFNHAVMGNQAAGPLTITAEEVNALIATAPELQALNGHVYITLEGDQPKAQVSIPADSLGLKPLRGRYFNGTGTFKVSFENGVLQVSLESLTVKGKPVPEPIMRHIRPQNLTAQLNADPQVQPVLARLQQIQIQEGKVTVTPRSHQ